jgi:hypothetical protein
MSVTVSYAQCRHCGGNIMLLPSGRWINGQGIYVCMKGPPGQAGVLHQPMPAGLRGEPRSAA